MAIYKWGSPLEWLMDKLESLGEDSLLVYAVELAECLDNDQVQNRFESEMKEDGYFRPSGQ